MTEQVSVVDTERVTVGGLFSAAALTRPVLPALHATFERRHPQPRREVIPKWILVLLAGGLALAAACTHRIVSSGPYVWQLRGPVVSVSDTLLQVRHRSGQVVDLQIDDSTSYTRNKQPDSRQSLQRGTRVMVDVESLPRGAYRARLVQIFGRALPR